MNKKSLVKLGAVTLLVLSIFLLSAFVVNFVSVKATTYNAAAPGLSVVLNSPANNAFITNTSTNFINPVFNQTSSPRNISFSFNTTWNSSVTPKNATLWGNFTGTWARNSTNTSLLINGTNSTIYVNVSSDGTYMWNVVLYDKTTDSLLNDTNSANWNVTVDTVWPLYDNTTIFYQPVITYSPYQYSNFSITWAEANIAGAYIESNFTGSLIKTPMLGTYPTYYYNSTPLNASVYMFRFMANDSAGNMNATGYINFTIGTAGQNITLYGITNQTYGLTDTPTCVGNITANLYKNNTVASAFNGTATMFGVANYTWTCNTTTNSNYTSNSLTYSHSISQSSSYLVNIYLNGTKNTNSSYTYPSYANVTGVSTPTGCGNTTIFRNNTFLFTNTPNSGNGAVTFNELLANTTYIFKVNTTGNVNCTANATGSSVYVYMNKGDPSGYIGVYMYNSTLLNYGAQYPGLTESRGNVSTIPGALDLVFNLYQDYSTLLGQGSTTNETANYTTYPISSYSFVYNTSGGQNWTAGTSITKFLVISAAPSVVTPSSGGGGGGSVSLNTETNTLTKKFDSIAASIPKTISESDLSSTNTQFTEIYLTANERLTDVIIAVEKVTDTPTSTGAVTGSVYNYVKIDKTNLNDSSISAAYIKFKVPKSWLTNNSIVSSTVSLYRFTTQWDKLTTVKLSEDSTYVYYRAETPGFSYFAVVGQTSAPTTLPPSTTIPGATTTIPATSTTLPYAPTGSTAIWLALIVLFIVIVVVIAVVTNKKLKKKIEKSMES